GEPIGDRLLGARQDSVRKLHLGVGTELLKLRDDFHQMIAWECGVHHQGQLRLPTPLEAASQELESIHVAKNTPRPLQQRLAMGGEDSLAPLESQEGDT